MKAPVSIYLSNSKLYNYPRPVDMGMENEIIDSYTLNDTFKLLIMRVYEVYIPTGYINISEFRLHKYKKGRFIIKVISKLDSDIDIKTIHNIQVVGETIKTYNNAKKLYYSIIDRYNEGYLQFNLI
jgi:hypothetical protein